MWGVRLATLSLRGPASWRILAGIACCALALAAQTDDEPKQVDALLAAATRQFVAKDPEGCRKSLEQARQLALSYADKVGEGKVAASYAAFYDARQEPAKAIEEASQAADLFHVAGRPSEESQAVFYLLILFQKANDQPKLIATCKRALPVAAEAGNTQLDAFANLTLAQYANLREREEGHEEALARFAKALTYFQKSSDRFRECMSWWGMGTAYDFLGNRESAYLAYVSAVRVASAIRDDGQRGRLLRSLGHDEIALKRWQDARQHLEQAAILMRAPAFVNDRALAEMESGIALDKLNQTEAAIKAYESAAAGSHTAGSSAFESTAWGKIAAIQGRSFDWQHAIESSRKAVKAARSPGGESMLPASLQMLSSEYLSTGQHRQSREIDLELLPMLHGKERLNLLIELGINCGWLARYTEALTYLNEGLAESAPNTAERAGLLDVLAEVHTELNNLPAALQEAQHSRDIYRALHIASGEDKALNQIGLIYQSIGDKQKSATALNEALAIERKDSNGSNECATLNNLGDLQRYFGDFRSAEPLYQQALADARKIGDRYREASILSNLGLAQFGLGRGAEAITTLTQAAGISHDVQDPTDEAKAISATGIVLMDTGDPQRAFDAYFRSLDLLQGTEDSETEAGVLGNIASAYEYLGDYIDAKTYLERARALREGREPNANRVVSLSNLATLELAQALQPGVPPEDKSAGLARAAELYAEALPLARMIQDKVGEARVLASQAVIASEQGRQADALLLLKNGGRLASDTGNVDSQALVEHTIGRIYAKFNEPAEAISHYRIALDLWKKIGWTEGEEEGWFAIAKLEQKAGKLDFALRDVRLSIGLSGGLHSRLHSDEMRSVFSARASGYYELEIDVLMQLASLHPSGGYESQAFEASEDSRARSLLDLLAEAHTDIREGVDPQLLAEEKSIAQSLAAKELLRRRMSQSPDLQTTRQALESEMTELRSKFDQVEARIRTASPGYAALTQPQPLDARKVQTNLLDRDTVLLEYSLGQERSYLWAVTSDSLSTYQLPGRETLERAAKSLSVLLRSREPIDEQAALLSDLLLKPAAKKLKRRIVIVADGELQQSVPFSVLPEPGSNSTEPLIQQHEVVTEPSASAVVILRQNRAARGNPPKLMAVIADPVLSPKDQRLQDSHDERSRSQGVMEGALRSAKLDPSGFLSRLKGTGTEAQGILRLGKPSEELALIGFDANKSAVMDGRLSDYRMVHFATHGLLNTRHPALSGLALSLYDREGHAVDGFLTLNDIYNLHLPVDLVVLSACESGQGEVIRGEGVVGLTRGFLYAGAATLVVTLWNVEDESTAELMQRFYECLLAKPELRAADALRSAQLSMMHDQRWSHPYYWAAFTAQGDWQ